MIIDPCGCVWRGNPRDGYDLTTCVVHWLVDMLDLVRLRPHLAHARSSAATP
jgi:hypothetical protein